MKLCVVAPSEEYLRLAGVRIRYRRIADHLEALGHALSIELIDNLRSSSQFKDDAYLFSKCYDARSRLIGRLLRGQGRHVGVDLFDDYFSQQDDSRFVCHRDWLHAMAGVADFFLCSTPRMHAVASQFLAGVPGHILNDPFDRADPQRITEACARNLERTLRTDRIDVAWFGVGDNPHFAVGLRDLHAFGHVLARLGRGGRSVRLRILTNRRALDADGLARLQRLPVAWDLDEWSVEAEEALLADSLAAFIPVNAQPFSIAKSLNRAVSALTAGTQVLSGGHALYQPLADLVYRAPEALLADLQAQRLLLREDSVPALLALLDLHGSPLHEAQRCASFLQAIQQRSSLPAKNANQPQLGILHGVRSLGVVHQTAQRLKQLSIGSPFSIPTLNYDLRLATLPDGSLAVHLSDTARARLAPAMQQRLTPAKSITGRDVHELDAAVLPAAATAVLRQHLHLPTRAHKLVAYGPVMQAMQVIALALFPGLDIQASEAEPPFHRPRPTQDQPMAEGA